jgi:uncharacterized membrane protein
MYLSSEQLLPQLIVVCGLIYLFVLYAAVRYAPWKKLMVRENSNTFFATLVGMLFLWMLGTEIEAGAVFHLSAMTSLTLMVGWQFAVIGGSLVLAGLILAQQGEWLTFLPSSMVSILVPVVMTWFLLALVRSLLPKHFFIYIFFNAFFTGAISMMSAAVCTVSMLLLSGEPFESLWNGFVIWIPLMLFPEAVLNGWIMTVLVGLKPEWVSTFSDHEYLHGK